MIELQNTKVVAAIPPAAIKDNADFSSRVIDLRDHPGASYLEFHGLLGATDIEMAVLKVMESDTKTDATTLGGTPTLVKDATTKPGASDDNKTFVIGIDLTKTRQRYLQLQAKAGNGTSGTFLAATAVIHGMTVAGDGATPRGVLFADYA